MSLKEELMQAAKSFLTEGLDSSKEIIANNATSFDNMGMAQANPGEFSDNEITDRDNLTNVAKLSNDTEFNNDDNDLSIVSMTTEIDSNDLLNDLLNLGADEESKEIEIVKKSPVEHEECEECKHNSKFATAMESVLNGKSFATILAESDFSGPTKYNPDHRIGSSEVLAAVKNAVKDAQVAAKLSINTEIDANEIPSYTILNADEKDLPDSIEIDMKTAEPIKLKREGKAYKIQ